MKNFYMIFCSICIIMFSIFSIASASPEYVWGNGTANWVDVNKNNVYGSDSLLCWAAAASNSLAWAGWPGWDSGTNSFISTGNSIYGVFTSNWSNHTGSPIYAYEWWMTNHTNANSNFPNEQLPTAGKNFYPGVVSDPHMPGTVDNFVQDGNGFSGNVLWGLQNYIPAHRAITASILIPTAAGSGTFGHEISIWGWDASSQTIYFTDPDDGATRLDSLNYQVRNNLVYLEGYSNLYTSAREVWIDELDRLNLNDAGILPTGYTSGTKSVPEPSTMLLLGAGIAGAGLFRKRFKS